jgi:hypothetical protein
MFLNLDDRIVTAEPNSRGSRGRRRVLAGEKKKPHADPRQGAPAINLGVEGMMIMGAACGFAGAWFTGSVLAGIVAGVLMAALFAALALGLAVSEVAAGLALTIFGAGLSGLIGAGFVGERIEAVPHLELPPLTDLPIAILGGTNIGFPRRSSAQLSKNCCGLATFSNNILRQHFC